MEVYCKASSVSEAEEVKDPCEVQIKSGKKIRASISQALKILQVIVVKNCTNNSDTDILNPFKVE